MSRALPVLVGCLAVAAACSGSPAAPTDAVRATRLSRTRFIAFGDSLTAGEITNPLGSGAIAKLIVVPSASYPSQLRSLLTMRYPSQSGAIVVSNAGVSGENIFRAVLRFEDELDAAGAEVALIMHGLNNLGGDGTDVPVILMRDMVRTATNRNARVFVGSMLPTVAGRLRSQNPLLLESYNAKLRQMTVEEGVGFVDLYAAMAPEAASLIGEDGLHPTEAGYRRVAEIFLAAISRELEER